MFNITAEQIEKLFRPTDQVEDQNYQIDFEIAFEDFISVMINCDSAIIVRTGVWSDFETKRKSYLANRVAGNLDDRERMIYKWVAEQINKMAEGASKEDVVIYKIKRKQVKRL